MNQQGKWKTIVYNVLWDCYVHKNIGCFRHELFKKELYFNVSKELLNIYRFLVVHIKLKKISSKCNFYLFLDNQFYIKTLITSLKRILFQRTLIKNLIEAIFSVIWYMLNTRSISLREKKDWRRHSLAADALSTTDSIMANVDTFSRTKSRIYSFLLLPALSPSLLSLFSYSGWNRKKEVDIFRMCQFN